MSASSPRRRDGQERRRELSDAAIAVLAEHGSRGLTHQNVDRYAGVPDGTTSYYYRTRAALLQAVGKRVAEIDTANLLSLTDAATESPTPFGRLAQLVMVQADGDGLLLNKARHELLLNAARDPELVATSQPFFQRVTEMVRDAIAHVQPDITDPGLLDAQSSAVMTFIAGIFLRFLSGDRSYADVEQLERQLRAIATAVAIDHADRSPHRSPR
ncbi:MULTISPECIES: TetR/AcrR family transcriptional regulator [unclassified Mycolicibacterium]|uniref:TetR/AcrR family transcriptional regulator n=1 Tax=unclassified Mycolicibacterium TaxID=2636767 RepID=UPI00130C4745|nr:MULTISPECIES: TetR/AcrR family transcriptional regulator [unclassified Mycolicibacterium]MUL83042.1 TetR/AcrR family transcriptional regulator [Mycolicibacterium sp. CBMA 329]MUL89377.1 TetR/AcrR family transcriptional regulator [Mycolicibacterium sp. CBMA 331]MUL99066.1 TetR/AcrR family transcriptional regulator [Mycolicibacterium sp. CBMA 334]MUM29967.1 TetR/AcrR family transcriptional regulator [Mycolicibacterium sp. CBMA 295]MUM38893.1 TetR/AcrR family transcriptional regulator [Mycolic